MSSEKELGKRYRIDFIQEVISVDEKAGTIRVALKPDPRRYEWKTVNGKRMLYDKLDKMFFTHDVLDQMCQQAKGIPVFAQPQMLGRAQDYVRQRIPEIEARLKGGFPKPPLIDKSEEFLNSLKADRLGFVILSLDIVGSTKLSTSLDPDQYANLISTVLFEISAVVPHFHGHILKYTGDGIIAYFPEPNFITKNDLALDCALVMRKLSQEALNPSLKHHGLPEIDIRLGLDSGEAIVTTIGSPKTKQHKDIIGAVISLACKIQTAAKPGEIYLGEATVRNLHVNWRESCREVAPPSNWSYSTDGAPYRIFQYRGMPPQIEGAKAVGRNDPCPCGSGKKFKKCCLDTD